jgi:hypothetical protein
MPAPPVSSDVRDPYVEVDALKQEIMRRGSQEDVADLWFRNTLSCSISIRVRTTHSRVTSSILRMRSLRLQQILVSAALLLILHRKRASQSKHICPPATAEFPLGATTYLEYDDRHGLAFVDCRRRDCTLFSRHSRRAKTVAAQCRQREVVTRQIGEESRHPTRFGGNHIGRLYCTQTPTLAPRFIACNTPYPDQLANCTL